MCTGSVPRTGGSFVLVGVPLGAFPFSVSEEFSVIVVIVFVFLLVLSLDVATSVAGLRRFPSSLR